MKATMLCSLGLMAAVSLAGPVGAQGGFPLGQRPPVRPAPGRGVMQQLDLSALQRRQLNQMRRARRDEQTRVNDAIKQLRGELAAMYRYYPLDEARANLMIQQIAALEAQRLRLQLQNQLDLRRILTRDQFLRFNQLLQTSQRPSSPLVGRTPGP
jgi:Spy/CpxP family protein refolding chaperone